MSVHKLKCGCKVSGDKIVESCPPCQEVWEIYHNAAKRQHDLECGTAATFTVGKRGES